MMYPLGGETVLSRVIARSRLADEIDDVMIATEASDHGASVSRGSEADVLDRYYRAAQRFDADTVVRITADCPLVDPAIVDRLIHRYHESGADCVSNKHKPTYPLSLQGEVLSMSTLETMWDEATRPEDRKHVTRYVRRSSEFRKQHVENRLDTAQSTATRDDAVLRGSSTIPRISRSSGHSTNASGPTGSGFQAGWQFGKCSNGIPSSPTRQTTHRSTHSDWTESTVGVPTRTRGPPPLLPAAHSR